MEDRGSKKRSRLGRLARRAAKRVRRWGGQMRFGSGWGGAAVTRPMERRRPAARESRERRGLRIGISLGKRREASGDGQEMPSAAQRRQPW